MGGAPVAAVPPAAAPVLAAWHRTECWLAVARHSPRLPVSGVPLLRLCPLAIAAPRSAGIPGMTAALALLGLLALLLFLRQPLLVILLSAAAFIHLVWGRGQLDYIVEDMWIG